MAEAETIVRERIPIRDGLLTEPLDDLAKVRILGSACKGCGEVSLGRNAICPNCGGTDLEARPLSAEGTLWTYTIVRHRPPGNYRGPEPFQPFCMGLVELPDGIRINSVVDGDIEAMEIGMPVKLKVAVHHRNDAGQEVVSFSFARLEGGNY